MSSQQRQQLGESIEQNLFFCITPRYWFTIMESVLSNCCYCRNISNSQTEVAALLYLTLFSTNAKTQGERGEQRL